MDPEVVWILVVLHNEMIKKMPMKKDNSTHHFWDNYLTNYLIKFLEDRIKSWKVGPVRVSTGYQFFLRNPLVKVLQINRVIPIRNIHLGLLY